MAVTQTSRRTRLDPAVRRRQIVEAARAVFERTDPAEVTLEEVAAEAGVSRSLVYSYFGDRGTLLAAAYVSELEQLDHEVSEALGDPDSDRDRLARLVAAYLRFAFERPAAFELLASATASRHPAVREAIEARTERIARVIGRSPETRVAIRGVIGLLEGAAIHALDQDELDLERLTAMLTQLLWRGVSSFTDDD